MKKAIIGLAAAIAAVGIACASPANADDDTASDQIFWHSLKSDGVLFSFELEKSEAHDVCDDVIWGYTPVEAIQKLMRNGGYPFDIANRIGVAGMMAYCWCSMDAAEGTKVYPALCRPYELSQSRRRF